MTRAQRLNGFTLVELSIVLVILGLLVGGVLAGQSLIGAAELRKQITQITDLRTANNAFREKYNYLPGDVPAALATQLGFVARSGWQANGDGNGAVSSVWPQTGSEAAGEAISYWSDLYSAGLIKEEHTSPGCDYNTASCPYTPVAAILMQGAMNSSDYLTIYFDGTNNVWQLIGNGVAMDPGGAGYWTGMGASSLTPAQLFNIDTKMDDGKPKTGTVVSRSAAGGIGGFDPHSTPEIVPGLTGTYCNDANDYLVSDTRTTICSPSFAF